jgi:hypothetical protein
VTQKIQNDPGQALGVLLHPCAAGPGAPKPRHDETATSTRGTTGSGFQRLAIYRRGDPMSGPMVSDVPRSLPQSRGDADGPGRGGGSHHHLSLLVWTAPDGIDCARTRSLSRVGAKGETPSASILMDSVHVDTDAMVVDLGWRGVSSTPDAEATEVIACFPPDPISRNRCGHSMSWSPNSRLPSRRNGSSYRHQLAPIRMPTVSRPRR